MNTVSYPIALRLEGRRVLVIGGGSVASRRILGLLDARAAVTVIATNVSDDIRALSESGAITLREGAYESGMSSGFALVLIATDDGSLNHTIAREARGSGSLVNRADAPDDCDFHVPSVVRSGTFTISLDSAGQAPVVTAMLSRALRQVALGHEPLARLVARLRPTLLSHPRGLSIMRGLATESVRDALASGDRAAAEIALRWVAGEGVEVGGALDEALAGTKAALVDQGDDPR